MLQYDISRDYVSVNILCHILGVLVMFIGHLSYLLREINITYINQYIY